MENFDDKYKKKNPYTVPEGYFESLDERIMHQMGQQEKRSRKRLVQWKPYLQVAAAFVIALLVVQFLMPAARDKGQGWLKGRENVVQAQDTVEEDIFDSQFNPTNEEIIEYLASEVDSYEWLYAGVY